MNIGKFFYCIVVAVFCLYVVLTPISLVQWYLWPNEDYKRLYGSASPTAEAFIYALVFCSSAVTLLFLAERYVVIRLLKAFLLITFIVLSIFINFSFIKEV